MAGPTTYDEQVLRSCCARPDERIAASEYGSVFPLPWYDAFLREVVARGIEVITYDDVFGHCDDRDRDSCYEREFKHWHESVRDPAKTYLLIQHDVDFAPQFTKRMVAMEALHGVRSNIFLFNRFVDEIPADSPYDETPYDVDHDFFRAMEHRGFVIGYHQNALTVTGDMDAATKQFETDVAALRVRYDLKYFCPHGGRAVDIAGEPKHNVDVPVPAEFSEDLLWVYNRFGPRWSGRYSDGGLRRLTEPDKLQLLDLMAFVDSMQPGKRYFALIHPQLWGWNINSSYNTTLAAQPWYQRVLKEYG